MKTFNEYLLDDKSITEQLVYLPNEAEVVNVSMTSRGLTVLAIVKPNGYDTELPKARTFKICSNGEIFYAGAVKYIGSFESLTGTKHVIEIIKEL